jgi:hypothetical protein
MIPLYLNYIDNCFPEMLDRAIESIAHPDIDVRVVVQKQPRPFTECLNDILRDVETSLFMFMHYDCIVLDNTIFDDILSKYNDKDVASVTACDITDLLVLYDTAKIREIGAWDPKFKNSYMDLDLRNRIFRYDYEQIILHHGVCHPKLDHKDASSLRNKEKDGNIANVYDDTFKNDMLYYYEKYPDEPRAEYYGIVKNGEYKFT